MPDAPPPPSITLRLIEDPAELGLSQDGARRHWLSPGGAMAVRRLGPAKWWWRNEHSQGAVQTMTLALTMLAFHTPELRDRLALGELQQS